MSTESLQAARLKAIEESGWGRSFRFYQPRNLAFWVYCLTLLWGLAIIRREWVTPGVHAYTDAFLLGLFAFTLYTVPFWLFLRGRDRYSALPGKLVVTAFIYGGFIATGTMALAANDAIRSLYSKAISTEWAFDWSAGLTAPFTEETAKASGLLLLIALAPKLIRTPFDGLIAGGFLGLGFQIVENVSYVYTSGGTGFGADQINLSITTLALRMVVGIGSHWAYSAIFCAGLVYLIGRPGFEPKRLLGVGLMLLAMLLHGLWDSVAPLTAGHGLATFPVMAVLLLVVLGSFALVFRMTVKTERDWTREIMAPEVEAGVITAEELDALSASRKGRKSFIKASGDRAARRRTKHVLEGAMDLAHQVAADRGEDTDAVRFARAEVLRLRG